MSASASARAGPAPSSNPAPSSSSSSSTNSVGRPPQTAGSEPGRKRICTADSTREKLLSVVDDMEVVIRELLENAIAVKSRRMNAGDHEELAKLLIEKDQELKKTIELAKEQGEIEEKIRALESEVEKQDLSISQMQKQFKEAETLLSTSIFQSKQKLKAIDKAQANPVDSEELIKYGHRISASNAVSAPLSWQQGDPRRPYPTDMEMRLGCLARPETATERPPGASSARSAHGATPSHSSTTPSHAPSGANPDGSHPFASPTKPNSGGATGFSWQGGEVGLTLKDGSHVAIEGQGHAGKEEVEVMSTDSSSSSSTDSN